MTDGRRKRPVLKARELEGQSRQYFARCQEEGALPTVPGLALALGLEGRKQLEGLSAGEGRVASQLRRALSQVEEANIQAAYKRDSGPSARFILQSGFGYTDKPGPGQAVETIQVRLTGGEGE